MMAYEDGYRCDHRWSDPSADAPPITCIHCGILKVRKSMDPKDVFDFDVRESAIDAVEKVFEGETQSGRPTIRVDGVSIAAIVVENERLRRQVTDLQERGTQMALERQQRRELNKKAIMDMLGQHRDSCGPPDGKEDAWVAYDNAITIVSRA